MSKINKCISSSWHSSAVLLCYVPAISRRLNARSYPFSVTQQKNKTLQGNLKMEFCTKSDINIEDISLIWQTQPAEASYRLRLELRTHGTKTVGFYSTALRRDLLMGSMDRRNDYSIYSIGAPC